MPYIFYCHISSNANLRQLTFASYSVADKRRAVFSQTRFESNAAKALVKALLNFIIKFNIQENQVVKNSQDHVSFVFFKQKSSSK